MTETTSSHPRHLIARILLPPAASPTIRQVHRVVQLAESLCSSLSCRVRIDVECPDKNTPPPSVLCSQLDGLDAWLGLCVHDQKQESALEQCSSPWCVQHPPFGKPAKSISIVLWMLTDEETRSRSDFDLQLRPGSLVILVGDDDPPHEAPHLICEFARALVEPKLMN